MPQEDRSDAHPRGAWGGARRLPGQKTSSLTFATCQRLLAAVDRAEAKGKPLNIKVDISWEHGGVPEKQVTLATQILVRKVRDWIRKHDGPLCWIYVHERGVRVGAHVHMLLHLKQDLIEPFRKATRHWVIAALPGGRYIRGTIRAERLRGAFAKDGVSDALYRHDLQRRLQYMLKAADPTRKRELGFDDAPSTGIRWGQKSTVYGRRAGWWQERAGTRDRLIGITAEPDPSDQGERLG